MAETPLAQLGLLAVAVNRTGDTTVAPFTGAVTVTVPPSAKPVSRSTTERL
jgi:hypothetical protein